MDKVQSKIQACLDNFIGSPIYSWIYMKAVLNRDNWMIEPDGYGETRLAGLKAYCKMDFLLPVQDEIHILDWKTGNKDLSKHASQLIGYAAAVNANFGIPWNKIFPKIVYLYPVFDELEVSLKKDDIHEYFEKIKSQTEEMHGFCTNVEDNIPLPIEEFPLCPSRGLCRLCKFQELCPAQVQSEPKELTAADLF